MPRQDGRIEPGQKLSKAISARAWNRAQEAADVVLGGRYGQIAGSLAPTSNSYNSVLVRNTSGFDVPWLGVLGISGIAINPSGGTLDGTDPASVRARSFASGPILQGTTPTTQSHRNTFVVAMEPIADGKMGAAAIGGAFACVVHVLSDDHGYAVVKDSDRTQLQSASCGPVQLLWKESGTGEHKFAVGAL